GQGCDEDPQDGGSASFHTSPPSWDARSRDFEEGEETGVPSGGRERSRRWRRGRPGLVSATVSDYGARNLAGGSGLSRADEPGARRPPCPRRPSGEPIPVTSRGGPSPASGAPWSGL